MNRLGSLYWIVILVSVAISGCTSTIKMEPAQSLSKEQAIVFGKVNVFVDGRHIEMTTSFFAHGFKSYLTIEFRQKGSSTTMEYKVDETGYFFWALAPGEYEVLGTHGFSAEVGAFDMMVPLAQRVWIPFTAQAEESVYLGDLTIELRRNRQAKQRLDDNYSEAIKEFHKRYPSARVKQLKKVIKLESPDPGTYTNVAHICSAGWGNYCSSDNIGITPISPDRLQDVVVVSTAPTLRWVPSSMPGVMYDVAIYEAYDSTWQKIVLDQLTGNKTWRRGRLLTYAQGLKTPRFKPDVSLQPDTTYLWSVRLRRGDTVSTWSQVKRTIYHVGQWHFSTEQWEAWLNFTTPSQ